MSHMKQPHFGLPTVAFQPEFLRKDPGAIVVLHQCRFPESYDIEKVHLIGGSDYGLFSKPGFAAQDQEDERVRGCFARHLHNTPDRFRYGPIEKISNRQLLEFLKDLLEVERVCPGLKWFGFQIAFTHDREHTAQRKLFIYYLLVGDRRARSVALHPDSEMLVQMSGMEDDY